MFWWLSYTIFGESSSYFTNIFLSLNYFIKFFHKCYKTCPKVFCSKKFLQGRKFIYLFQANVTFLYLQKDSENWRFFYVFQGCKNEKLGKDNVSECFICNIVSLTFLNKPITLNSGIVLIESYTADFLHVVHLRNY